MISKNNIASFLYIAGISLVAVSVLMAAYAFAISKPAWLCLYFIFIICYAGPAGINMFAISKIMTSEKKLKKLKYIGLIILPLGFEISMLISLTGIRLPEIGSHRIQSWFIAATYMFGFALYIYAELRASFSKE